MKISFVSSLDLLHPFFFCLPLPWPLSLLLKERKKKLEIHKVSRLSGPVPLQLTKCSGLLIKALVSLALVINVSLVFTSRAAMEFVFMYMDPLIQADISPHLQVRTPLQLYILLVLVQRSKCMLLHHNLLSNYCYQH